MRSLYLLGITISIAGCAYGVSESIPDTTTKQDSEQREAPKEKSEPTFYDAGSDACIPKKIVLGVDPIPKFIDWNCPPVFYELGWIPPHDPGPVIK